MKTSLYSHHIELNAKMVDFAGWEMPIQYKNLKEEVLAVRNSVGVFDVSHMGEFFVEGAQALNFVDYLVTNDIKNAPTGKAIYSPLCREDGTIIDDLIVYKISNERIMICVNASNIEKDFCWMSKYSERFDCTFSNQSNDFSLLAVQGPDSFKTLSEMQLGFTLNDMDYYSIQEEKQDSKTVLVARTGYTGEDGFEIFGPHEYIKNLWTDLIQKGVAPCGLGARDVLRLEVCYPLYGHELNDNITPLDAGLKWTVKSEKEDFVGRKYLSTYSPKFLSLKLILDKGIPRDHYEVESSSGQKLGEITSGTMSVMLNKGIALARVDKNLYNSQDEIFVNIRGKKYPATICKKPFVSGGHK